MENTSKAELAHRLCDLGKFQEALQFLKELEHDSKDPSQVAGYLLDEATCLAHSGNLGEAQNCIGRARLLVSGDPVASVQIDFLEATLLIEGDQSEVALQILLLTLGDKELWFHSTDGRELYEKIQVQRGFTLMHISKLAEARPILEEASSFRLEDDVKSSIHCHLGRCYHELGHYTLAREHFILAQNLKIPEDWADTFHYYYGYTLYRLKDFDAARREFVLSLQSGSSGPPTSYKYKMLAATHRKLGEFGQARRYEDLAKLEEHQR